MDLISHLADSEIVGSVRRDETGKFLSVIDSICVVTGKIPKRASEELKNILARDPKISDCIGRIKFPGKGQQTTPAATRPTIVEILFQCAGENAREFRKMGAETFCRAMGGDATLLDEILKRHEQIAGTEEEEIFLGWKPEGIASADVIADNPVARRLYNKNI
jgi:hypothetical protein